MPEILLALLRIGMAAVLLVYLVPRATSLFRRFRLYLVRDPAHGVAAAPPKAQSDGKDLSQELEAIRRRYRTPALAAAIVAEGRLAALGAAGVRQAGEGQAAAPSDRFHLGSCTKAMTATLCARLVEAGKMDWKSTLEAVFPDLASDIRPGFREATLEHLLTHRAGIDEGPLFARTVWPKVWELEGPLAEQRVALIKMVCSQEPFAPPGGKFEYSNCGYAIAAAMCERVARQSWEDLMRQELFEPLGMATAGFGAPGSKEDDGHPWGHAFGFLHGRWAPMHPGDRASDNPAAIRPAGGVHASLEDWAKFAILHLEGARGESRFLRPETFRRLHAPALEDYGMGWILVDRRWAGGRALHHAGSNTLWYSVAWLAPKRNLALLAATNLGTANAYEACDRAMSKMLKIVERS
jgi:CubicO group peptidase (beta-lactamase class C family)